jgi:hypothetical protein
MAITNATLNTTAANVLYAASNAGKAVTTIYLCNVSGSTATANLFLVPAGGTVADCRIYSNLNIASTDTSIADTERIILENGDSLWANCSVAGAVVMTVSSVGI